MIERSHLPSYIEGRSYTVGRAGQIRIEDSSLSRGHAEIRFVDGKILLRDLDSTNGTYLVVDEKLVKVDQVFVRPNQRVVMGKNHYRVKELLARAGIYASFSEEGGLIVKLATPTENRFSSQHNKNA